MGCGFSRHPVRPERLVRFGIALAALLSVSCSSVSRSISDHDFVEKHGDARYCGLEAIKQQSRSACGAACLESVTRYWKLPGSQQAFWENHPPADPSIGYTLEELKAVAEAQGLKAFAVSFEKLQPLPLLHAQLSKGRPVVLALRCPYGRYFGDPVPVIEHLDSTVLNATIREERYTDLPIVSTRDRKKNHFVVAFGYDKAARKVLLMDPAWGLVSIGEHRFATFWRDQNYAALLCAPAPKPEAITPTNLTL